MMSSCNSLIWPVPTNTKRGFHRTGRGYSANVVAAEPTELLTIRREHFISLIYKHPHIATEILSELASRLRKTDMEIKGLAQMNVASRVSKTILNLVVERGLETVEGCRCRSDPTHQELAWMADTKGETVLRVRSRL